MILILYHSEEWRLEGRVPTEYSLGRNISLPTLISQTDSDSVSTTIILQILPYPFSQLSFPNLTVSPDQHFRFSFVNDTHPSQSPCSNYTIVADAPYWLHVDDNPLSIYGVVSTDSAGSVNITLGCNAEDIIPVSSSFYLNVIPILELSGSSRVVNVSVRHVAAAIAILASLILLLGCSGWEG